MSQLPIKTGTKLSLRYADDKTDKDEFRLRSTFEKNVNDTSFLMSIPLLDGKRLEADHERKLLIRYGEGNSTIIVEGYVDDVVKQGIRQYWKVRKVTEGRKFFKRQDERIQASVDVTYSKLSWIGATIDDRRVEEGQTLDFSLGGIALMLNDETTVGEIIEVTFPTLSRAKAGQSVSTKAECCWQRKLQKGSGFRFASGLKFIFETTDAKKQMQAYFDILIKQVNS